MLGCNAISFPVTLVAVGLSFGKNYIIKNTKIIMELLYIRTYTYI